MSSYYYVECHELRVLPCNNINSDDTRAPKSCTFGNAQRVYFTSQCRKYAQKQYYKRLHAQKDLGVQTRMVVDLIESKIAAHPGRSDKEKNRKDAETALKYAGITTSKGMAQAVFLISDVQAEALADLIVAGEKDKKLYQKAISENPSQEIYCYGRFYAGVDYMKVDAACQVGYAMTTHKAEITTDVFTATDDLAPNSGAGHLDTQEFTSGVYYGYSSCKVHALKEECPGQAAGIVRDFVEANFKSVPTGKINAFAHSTIPNLMMITIRDDNAYNLMPAFFNPVKAKDIGLLESSKKVLAEYLKGNYNNTVPAPVKSFFCCGEGEYYDVFGEKMTFMDMLDAVEAEVRKYVEKK